MTFTEERHFMYQSDLLRALDIWQDVANDLNTIIRTEGEIKANDRRIWQGHLHRWSNNHWRLILKAGLELAEHHPELFSPFHEEALYEAWMTFTRDSERHPRCMDQKTGTMDNKKVSWRWLMSMRELWNRCNDQG